MTHPSMAATGPTPIGAARHGSAKRVRIRLFLLVACFALALVARLYRIDQPGVLVDRDFTSAIFARDFFFSHQPGIEAWRQQTAHAVRERQPILEPPITEWLASVLYRVTDGERLWVARLMTTLFWLCGGVFLYLLVEGLLSPVAAFAATVYYLFVPLGVSLSRSFQPDALMMLLFLASIHLFVRYLRTPSVPALLLVAAVTGLGLLNRPLVVFTLAGAFAAMTIANAGTWKALFRPPILLIAALSLLPFAVYYGWAIVFAGFMRWKVATSFRPDLFGHREFWIGWRDLGLHAVGIAPLLLALVGIFHVPRGIARGLLLGLTAGYIVFGLAFTMHIHTHHYYHAQLIPLIAIPLGALTAMVVARIRESSRSRYVWAVPVAALAFAGAMDVHELARTPARNPYEDPKIGREIGDIVGHSTKVVFLAPYYGVPLQYHGELTGAYWPRNITYWLYRQPGERERTVAERLHDIGFSPEYFVITHLTEFANHHDDLRSYLTQQCSLVAAQPKYLIYKNCHT
jgi:hypothetical protein